MYGYPGRDRGRIQPDWGHTLGDAGEGLIDAEARIQERIEDLQRERSRTRAAVAGDPELLRMIESLRLARTELERQLEATRHDRRRAQIGDAIAEIDRRMADATARL